MSTRSAPGAQSLIPKMAAGVAILALFLILAYLAFVARPAVSEYTTIKQDVTGTLTKLNSDNTAMAMDTEDGQLATRIINPGGFNLKPGDTLTGTWVDLNLGGGQSGNGFIVASVTPGP